MTRKLRDGRRIPRTAYAAAALTIVVLLGALASGALGLVSLETHRGFFAPAWGLDGRTVYFLERRTRGATWGLGWEFFSPPAYAYVIDDQFRLNALDTNSGEVQVLVEFQGSPVAGRVTRNYRNRIFNSMSAWIDAREPSLRFGANMDLPVVPRADPWHVSGNWPGVETPAWQNVWAARSGPSTPVLMDGRELMLTDGAEGYPAAILAVAADGAYDVLLANEVFDHRYADGVPARWIAERSRREQILRVKDFEDTHARLVAEFRAAGLNEMAASLAAYDRMKETGHLPPDPQVVATALAEAPAEVPVFDIPAAYFEVGLFRDIAAAIAAPGTSVTTGTGDYLKYYDDDVGVRLREFRKRHDSFHVRSQGRVYRLEVSRE